MPELASSMALADLSPLENPNITFAAWQGGEEEGRSCWGGGGGSGVGEVWGVFFWGRGRVGLEPDTFWEDLSHLLGDSLDFEPQTKLCERRRGGS